jgi:hypothetical protein
MNDILEKDLIKIKGFQFLQEVLSVSEHGITCHGWNKPFNRHIDVSEIWRRKGNVYIPMLKEAN